MVYAICLGLFIPLLGFLILMAASATISRTLVNIIGCSTVFISFLCFLSFLITGIPEQTFTLFNWIHFNQINADFALRLDALSLLMTLIITGVGFLIHLYSIGYIEHEEDYARFYSCMNFFIFAMLLLVLAANLLLLFVGWEGVGLASYLLIGYWYHRPTAAQAATKAFVVNRIGDLGFLLGLLLTFQLFGTSDIAEVMSGIGQQYPTGAAVLSVLALLYFVGAIGKSAQLPLHTWLPDAMEGPTPVSALIHAATMVTAGVYLVVRMNPLYTASPEVLYFVGAIGAITSLFAALCALGQTDLKRVLAYSTVSQLGLMFLACGVGAFYAAMFHLTMHAFVKALLFLSAGNVVHMMQGVTDMSKMGGLSEKFYRTTWLFLIGVLALSGIPPLAAFFSKDLLLDEAHAAGYQILFFLGFAASVLTAFYLVRAYCLAFTGSSNLEQKIFKAIKEAPRVMLAPVTLLAALSVVGGFLGYAFGKTPLLQSLLAKVGIGPMHTLGLSFLYSPTTILSVVGAFLGAGSAAVIYTKYANRLGNTVQLLKNSFYVDQLYDIVVVRPLAALSQLITKVLEPKIFDGAIRVGVEVTESVAKGLQQMQSGQIRSYVAWMVAGIVVLMVTLYKG